MLKIVIFLPSSLLPQNGNNENKKHEKNKSSTTSRLEEDAELILEKPRMCVELKNSVDATICTGQKNYESLFVSKKEKKTRLE